MSVPGEWGLEPREVPCPLRACAPCSGMAHLSLCALLQTPECPHSVGRPPWRTAKSSASFPTGKHLCTRVVLHSFLAPTLGFMKREFKTRGLNETK